MKKLLAALLSLCLMLTAFAAFAEEQVTKVSWSDYEAKAAEVPGQFVNLATTGLKMYVPNQFKDTEIPKESQEAGLFLLLKSEDGKAVVTGQLVEIDVNTFAAGIKEKGYSVWSTEVNGTDYIQFSVTAEGVTNTSFALSTTSNQTLVFSFAPADQEPYASLFKLMAASMQAAK